MLSKVAFGALTSVFLSVPVGQFEDRITPATTSSSLDGCAKGYRAVFTPAIHGCFPETAQTRP